MRRSPNGINVHRFLEGYGVRVMPYNKKRDPRPANVIYGGREVARLLRKDLDRTGVVVRCIQASNPICFDDIYLWSVWRFLTVHFGQRDPRDAIQAFSGIDIAALKNAARLCSCWRQRQLLCSEAFIMVSRAILSGWPLVAPAKKDYGRNVVTIPKGSTVALIADSTGTGVQTGSVGTGQVASGWFRQLDSLLWQRGVHASSQNRMGCASGSWATLLTMDSRVSSTGAWAQTGSLAPGGNSFGASAAGSASFALGRSTKLVIYWVNNTAGRVFTYSVDSGDPVDITTTGVYEIRKTVISVPRGHHTLTLAQKTAACNILGVEAYDDTDGMPIRLLNFSISGATSTQLADNTDAVAGRRAGYAYHAPDVTFIEGGLINDAVQAIPAATTKANLLAMAAAVRVNKPAGKVIFVTPNPIGETPTIRAALEAGVQVMKEAAAEAGNGLIDIYGLEGNYENENRLGRMSDSRHPNTGGYGFIATNADRGIVVV